MCNDNHAWILVEFSNGWLAYETTTCHWVTYEDDPSYYTGTQYDSIHDIWNDYQQYSNGEEVFEDDWAWWIE